MPACSGCVVPLASWHTAEAPTAVTEKDGQEGQRAPHPLGAAGAESRQKCAGTGEIGGVALAPQASSVSNHKQSDPPRGTGAGGADYCMRSVCGGHTLASVTTVRTSMSNTGELDEPHDEG